MTREDSGVAKLDTEKAERGVPSPATGVFNVDIWDA